MCGYRSACARCFFFFSGNSKGKCLDWSLMSADRTHKLRHLAYVK